MIGEENIDKHDFASKYKNKEPKKKTFRISVFASKKTKEKKHYHNLERAATQVKRLGCYTEEKHVYNRCLLIKSVYLKYFSCGLSKYNKNK